MRALMVERNTRTGNATNLLRAGSDFINSDPLTRRTDWPDNPRALAASPPSADLPTLGIEISFSREGRAGNRIINIRTALESTVSTVSGDPPDTRAAAALHCSQ
jgi:hypothetical protein